jgi:plastocyanin
MVDYAFGPPTVRITVGDSVRWTNDQGAHTTTSGRGGDAYVKDGRWDSGFLDEGSRYSVTFETAGTYPYFCEIHPIEMRGRVIVEP